MSDKEWQPSTVFDLFGDDQARQILVLASERPMAADDLADLLDVSKPTVYRRVNTLLAYDLMTEHEQIEMDGNNYKTYETTLKQVSFQIEDGGYDIDIQIRRSLVDQFEAFWSDLEESGSKAAIESTERTARDRSRGDSHHG